MALTNADMQKAMAGLRALQRDPVGFWIDILGWRDEWIWSKMVDMAVSVRDNPKTAVRAGHSVSKTHSASGLVLWFLYCFPPCTVVTTAPTAKQVEDVLWRQIRENHARAKVPLFGDIHVSSLDLQPETGLKWFATGFSTRPDTVTKEATAFQGYHNENMLKIFDEAAGVAPEIWRAAEGVGGNRVDRFLALGNATAGSGDFARCFKDPDYNKIVISVMDTPNYKEGSNRIPGLFGREYVERMRRRYGEDSDEFKVRVLGEISAKSTPGAYYAEVIQWLRDNHRIGELNHNPSWPVHTVWDPGYTTAIWFFQLTPMGRPNIIRYHEDQGIDWTGHAALLEKYRCEYGYRYGQHFAPFDVDNNQYRLAHADGMLELAARAGIFFTRLAPEKSVQVRIDRTREFLRGCCFDLEGCSVGIGRLEAYHESVNQRMSDEDNIVFTGEPCHDANSHSADAMGYMILGINRIRGGAEVDAVEVTEHRRLVQRYRRPG